jgi:hypothetical protein
MPLAHRQPTRPWDVHKGPVFQVDQRLACVSCNCCTRTKNTPVVHLLLFAFHFGIGLLVFGNELDCLASAIFLPFFPSLLCLVSCSWPDSSPSSVCCSVHSPVCLSSPSFPLFFFAALCLLSSSSPDSLPSLVCCSVPAPVSISPPLFFLRCPVVADEFIAGFLAIFGLLFGALASLRVSTIFFRGWTGKIGPSNLLFMVFQALEQGVVQRWFLSGSINIRRWAKKNGPSNLLFTVFQALEQGVV